MTTTASRGGRGIGATDGVRTVLPAGALIGAPEDGVVAFKGVPFAQPPVGALRWRPPQPAPRWEGDRPADQFGPAPIQPQPPRNSIMFRTNFDDRQSLVMSEDCLFLNVWTPDPSTEARMPVMVWIHGGGNRYGHGSQDVHNGAALARRGIVVVTLNHRLGALGFLAHPDLATEDRLAASGNYGLLDICAVLEWVQQNISELGGDPSSVTVAGNSAGAAHITHLMASASARSLFRAAIGQSSSGVFRAEGPLAGQEAAHMAGVEYATSFAATSIERLRQISPVDLVVRGHFGPVIDGRLLTTSSDGVFLAGDQARVPLLVGTVRDEGSNYTKREDAAGLLARAQSVANRERFEAEYPTGESQLGVSARLWTGESRFVYPVRKWANTHARTAGMPTWLYQFTREPPLPPDLEVAPPPDGGAGFGAFHTSELPYTSDNLACRPWSWTEADRELAQTMADAWANFVTNLNPNGPGLPNWPAYGGKTDELMVFDLEPHVATPDRSGAMRLLDEMPRPL